MNYEQKYKEALEKARQLCAYPTSKPFISDLQDLFPELKESEGERIRKSIINLVIKSAQNGGMALHKWESQQMLAWLEEQGEHNYTWKPSDEQMNALNVAIGEAHVVDTAAGDEAAEILTSLYQELKKLREE